MIGVRCSGFADSENEYITGMDQMPGIWFSVNATGSGSTPAGWSITTRLDDAQRVILASGQWKLPWLPGVPHTMRLIARNNSVLARVDGALIARVLVVSGKEKTQVPPTGFVALGSEAFGHYPVFTSYQVTALESTCSGVPQAGITLYEEACAAGTPGQSFTMVQGAVAPGVQFRVTANPALCLSMNRTSDPEYRYSRTRFVTILPCNGTEPRQFFNVEGGLKDGPFNIGPITGPDGLVLNMFGNSESDDTEVESYIWQGGSNGMFTFDSLTGLIYAPQMGTCVGMCSKV
jgi:hypothetical protein